MASSQEEKAEKVKKIKRKHRRILEHTSRDIRYRGPLSYRHFRIFAWLCIALSQVVLLMRLDQLIEPEYAAVYTPYLNWFGPISMLALPFLLIANFATILDGQEGYGRQLFRFGALSFGVIGGCFLLYYRYLLGTVSVLIQSRELAPEALDDLVQLLVPDGFLSFNIFMDLFMCSLFMFFLNCQPKRLKGKKVLILRFLALIPVAYEIASLTLKLMAGSGQIRLPVWSFAFLTTKPPLTFVVFIILAFYVKKRERLFRRHGKTHEEFQQYLQTNYNSLRFSLFASKIFLLAALLDLLLLFLIPAVSLLFGDHTLDTDKLSETLKICGFGSSISLIPMIPFMLLFSYTRKYKNRLFDTVLPLCGIAAIALIYLEGSYQAFTMFGQMLISPEIGTALFTLLGGLLGH